MVSKPNPSRKRRAPNLEALKKQEEGELMHVLKRENRSIAEI
jgi:hypothetical protein